MDTEPKIRSRDILRDNSRVILTEGDLIDVPWVMNENLLASGFPGSNSSKYILKDDPETVIRVNGHDIAIGWFQREMPMHEEGFAHFTQLREQFDIHVPECDFRVVNPYLIYPDYMGLKHPSIRDAEFKALGPVDKLETAIAESLKVFVKTEYIHGKTLSDIKAFSPDLLKEIDHLAGNLVWYYAQGYLANPGQKFVGLVDIISPEQYMWGWVSSKPHEKHLYLADLEFDAKEMLPDFFMESVFREIAYIYWSFVDRTEKISRQEMTHAREQIQHALSLFEVRDPEMASELRRAISFTDIDEFEEEFYD